MSHSDYGPDDPDAPQPEDVEDLDSEGDEDGGDDRRCPACGRAVYWGAPKCPHCGEWFAAADSDAAERSLGWRWPAIVALLIAIILVMWQGLGR